MVMLFFILGKFDTKWSRKLSNYFNEKFTYFDKINHAKEKNKNIAAFTISNVMNLIFYLQNDKRYLVLDCVSDERKKMLTAYIDDLDRKGPPPPPTASEPSRRSTKWVLAHQS